ncbi:hypothetical protein SM373_30030, partial [Salmonella enterica]|nr:hypothetical protein [Salmonella enterica]
MKMQRSLTSLVMAFIGVPLLVNIITIIVGGMWA